MNEINSRELIELIKNNEAEIIDVREPEEEKIIKITSSRLFPLDDLLENWEGINWNKTVVFYCRKGYRGAEAVELAEDCGCEAFNLAGGVFEMFSDQCFDYLETEADIETIENYFEEYDEFDE